ncbi:acetyltransferase, GNAT family [Aeromicrobium marinum DSM 15272]|uniref:Acetyltransferase, GNAT family n=1 Tax=Aeromicrobium marinum DSM 15272 TaxID=585531 RepID=E2SFS3_9ACTN|nr:GNAT family N-acetyltransferase [Aeromicrobium marinum]EFQ81975.1 acetyltransferase, GNAT family [Aeromicrobium marinum DSM 15272]
MITVTDHAEASRFEAHDGETLAGFADYLRTGELMAFTHTEVRSAYEGQGVGSLLARAGVEAAEAEGVKVLAICPFISGWLARHPDLAHLEYRAHSTVVD